MAATGLAPVEAAFDNYNRRLLSHSRPTPAALRRAWDEKVADRIVL
jgi:hypothetical protein